MRFTAIAFLAALAAPAAADIYFKEQFNDAGWSKRWTESTKWKSTADMGTWKHTAGSFFADEADKGIQTSVDAKFYGISAPLEKTFTSGGKDLVLQYSVKLEETIDCAGAYIKLLPGGKKFDSAKFGGDAEYAIMFGPDICGSSNKKTHVILRSHSKKDNLQIKKEVSVETDKLTHLYTLVIRPDNTFEVFVDQKSVRSGKLEDEFDFLEAKEIKDPDAKKPEDWVDEKMMDDPEDKKPDGWDDTPKEIKDPDAKKPEDWDDEDDGEWEAPMISNPEYKGVWKAKKIENPEYKGKWVHPKIPNPEYKEDPELYKVCKDGCTHVGFELWQVKSGVLFDNIIVTDSLEEAQEFAKETFVKNKDAEKAALDKHEEANKPDDVDADADADLDDEDDLDDGAADEF